MSFRDDLALGVRQLTRRPALTATAVTALALGIGLTTMMFSIVHGILLRGLPFPESERLVHVELSRLSEGVSSLAVSVHELDAWREAQRSLEGLAAFQRGTFNVSGPEARPERHEGAYVSANTFGQLGVTPALGRDFLPEDDAPGAAAVVMISHVIWQDRFQFAPDVVGRTLRVNGETSTIIGVMPERFGFPVTEYLWVPLRADPLASPRGTGYDLEVFGRLHGDTSLDEAAAELASLTRRLELEYPETHSGMGVIMKPYVREFLPGEAITTMFTMLGAVLGVLLVACANVANLLLARAAMRAKEVAVRCALGASRARVVSLLLTETLVVAAVGATVGLGLAQVGIDLFNAAIVVSDPPFWFDIKIDATVVAFVIALVGVTTLVAGGLPALQAADAGMEALKDEARGSTGLRVGRWSRAIVVVEIALSCGLLVATGLMIQSVVNLRSVDLGFATDDVLTARVTLFENDYPTDESRLQLFERLKDRLDSMPGARSASLVTQLPGRGAGSRYVAVQGEAYASEEDYPRVRSVTVTPDAFDTVGTRVLQGRDFSASDRATTSPVAIVNQKFADRFFPGRPAVGEQIRFTRMDAEQPWMTIVGIAPDLAMHGLDPDPPEEGVYVPLTQHPRGEMTLAVRAAGDPFALTSSVRDEVEALDPTLPIYFVRSLAGAHADDNWFYGVFATLFMAFGSSALFLASVGLYGVMSFSVSQRTREIGVRMALGAGRGDVLWLVLRQGVIQLGFGLAVGLALGGVLSQMVQAILFGVHASNATLFAGVVLTLASAGTLACLLPARRATQVDPMQALRYE
jgi:predicted permease